MPRSGPYPRSLLRFLQAVKDAQIEGHASRRAPTGMLIISPDDRPRAYLDHRREAVETGQSSPANGIF